MPALDGELQVVVKDPIEDVAIQNPPPANVTNTTIPQAVEDWPSDNDPNIPNDVI